MTRKNMLRGLCLFAFLLVSGAGHAESCDSEALKSLVFEGVQVRFVKEQGRGFVETIGTLRNTSGGKVEDIQIVTRHLDAKQQLIDVQQDYLYGLTLAPGEDLAFRLRTPAAHSESAYASHQTRVVAAGCEYSGGGCTSGANSGDIASAAPDESQQRQWIQWLWSVLVYNILPLLLLIVVWIVLARKYSGAKSPTVQRLERQLDLTSQQNTLLERIAQALEERNKA